MRPRGCWRDSLPPSRRTPAARRDTRRRWEPLRRLRHAPAFRSTSVCTSRAPSTAPARTWPHTSAIARSSRWIRSASLWITVSASSKAGSPSPLCCTIFPSWTSPAGLSCPSFCTPPPRRSLRPSKQRRCGVLAVVLTRPALRSQPLQRTQRQLFPDPVVMQQEKRSILSKKQQQEKDRIQKPFLKQTLLLLLLLLPRIRPWILIPLPWLLLV
mmetsp:Transcript_7155/g.21911  ORF Transcript_7155/g.21911 Transcript_7155/m.21911 type:complete len:213 (+) Transcript_7155:109-747(+)